MNKKYYYIANWKMYWNFDQTINFATAYHEDFIQLSQDKQIKIILCPSLPTLHSLAQIFVKTDIALGSQDCSEFSSGAYTGHISAEHLQTAGAGYCIIGHSERRKYNNETDEMVAQKCLRLVQAGVTPIVCIGETLEQHQRGTTFSVLESQLKRIIQARPTHLFIAYEPVWAIGTGLIPTNQHLTRVFIWLADFVAENFPTTSCSLMYGGSVASKNIQELKMVDLIDGFLIGGASLDFDEFAKIIKSPIKGSLQ